MIKGDHTGEQMFPTRCWLVFRLRSLGLLHKSSKVTCLVLNWKGGKGAKWLVSLPGIALKTNSSEHGEHDEHEKRHPLIRATC